MGSGADGDSAFGPPGLSSDMRLRDSAGFGWHRTEPDDGEITTASSQR